MVISTKKRPGPVRTQRSRRNRVLHIAEILAWAKNGPVLAARITAR